MLLTLPETRLATEPAEARGLERDEVRLLVTFASNDSFVDTQFTHFPEFLRKGDVIVVNSTATVNAALQATRPNGESVELHLSQRLDENRWVIELRRQTSKGTLPLRTATAGEVIAIPAGGKVTLLEPYGLNAHRNVDTRLWLASVNFPDDHHRYLDRHGFPIRYGYVPGTWPLEYYQTFFAETPGSAEMASAARPFTTRVVDALTNKGVTIVPILLHTGVSSLEDHEAPYPEFYRVGNETARVINEARDRGSLVVAIGTTAVRALETVADSGGKVTAGEGWTDLVISPDRGLRTVDAMLTGLHEPQASHLAMLEALAGREHVERAYSTALRLGYLWHEFGDVHLILPAARRG